MRRWSSAQDRNALIGGYAGECALSETFGANWRVISVANLMLDFAHRPQRRPEALAGLRSLLTES